MKLIHHVKKHGKTITLHLKKHHKKYIFGILSATLLWKGVSLIAAYALVHNLSFSFADTVHQGETDNEDIVIEETIVNEQEQEIPTEPDEPEVIENSNEPEFPTEPDEQEIIENSNEAEFPTEYEETIVNEQEQEIPTEPDEPTITENSEDPETPTEPEEPIVVESENENGICDEGDIIITSPIGGDIVGKAFDITRKFMNNDCENERYIIKLRESNDEYIEIFSGDKNTTGFSFDSTQLLSNYYSGHKISIKDSADYNTIYRNKDGGEFTIDNKSPVLSNTGVKYSTKNNKINIGDTVTVSFESDEELSLITVNIQGKTAYLEEKDGNKYKYTMEFSKSDTTGKIVYGIDYSDIVGNTGYYERYDNTELDYTAPEISNLQFIYLGDNKLKITFNTNEKTETNFVYQLSGINKTNSEQTNLGTTHEYIIQNIKNSYKYNYSISILDEAQNELNIGGIFFISENKANFTNKEITKSELLIKAGFNSENDLMQNLKTQLNNFGECTNNINIKTLNLSLNKGQTAKVQIPEINNTTINKLTSAFTIVLFERIEKQKLEQREIDEITEDLNNFLMVVKIVKDDENDCKNNMNQYYINRFKKTLIRYNLADE